MFRTCFNPLNQVYVFNPMRALENVQLDMRFNALNHVYFFKKQYSVFVLCGWIGSLNPLNQVYVFNKIVDVKRKLDIITVLIP